jgi:hypothetical protein
MTDHDHGSRPVDRPGEPAGPIGVDRTGARGRDGTYVLGPLDRSGLLFGFGLGELVLLGVAGFVCFMLLQAGVPVWGYGGLLVVAVAVCRRRWPGGLQLLEYAPILRCRVDRARTGGRWRAAQPWDGARGELPGPLGGVEVVEVPAVGFGPVGVWADRGGGAATFVIELSAGSFLLASAREQADTLARWGRLLGSTVETGRCGVRHVSCTVISSQGSARDHLAFVEGAGTGAVAAARPARDYARLVEMGAEASSRHRILFSVTVAARRAGTGGWGFTPPGAVAELSAVAGGVEREQTWLREVGRAATATLQDLRSLGWAFQAPLDRAKLLGLLGECVDPGTRLGRAPQADRGIDALFDLGPGPDHRRDSLGGGRGGWGLPVSTVEEREYVIVNGVAHRTYWVQAWPNYGLGPDWMVRLLAEVAGERRFTVFFRPVPRSESARAYERDIARHDSSAITAAEKGKRVSLGTRRAHRDTVALGEDLLAGYPEVELCALATVSAPNLVGLQRRCDAFASLAVSHGITLAPLRDAQELAWRDSTPFGFCPIKARSPWA